MGSMFKGGFVLDPIFLVDIDGIRIIIDGRAQSAGRMGKAHVEATDLSHYKRPREYRLVTELPRGNTGKVSRRMMRSQVTGK